MATTNDFFNVPLFEENNDQHQLAIKVILDGDTMELTYHEVIWEPMETIVDSATFDAKGVRKLYDAANNQELTAHLIMDYNIGGNGATAFDDLLNYLHKNNIYEQS